MTGLALAFAFAFYAAFGLYRVGAEALLVRAKTPDELSERVSLIPWEYDYQVAVGNRFFNEQMPHRAQAHYLAALRYAPFLWVAANNLGSAYAAAGDVERARYVWELVRYADPGNREATRGLRILAGEKVED